MWNKIYSIVFHTIYSFIFFVLYLFKSNLTSSSFLYIYILRLVSFLLLFFLYTLYCYIHSYRRSLYYLVFFQYVYTILFYTILFFNYVLVDLQNDLVLTIDFFAGSIIIPLGYHALLWFRENREVHTLDAKVFPVDPEPFLKA